MANAQTDSQEFSAELRPREGNDDDWEVIGQTSVRRLAALVAEVGTLGGKRLHLGSICYDVPHICACRTQYLLNLLETLETWEEDAAYRTGISYAIYSNLLRFDLAALPLDGLVLIDVKLRNQLIAGFSAVRSDRPKENDGIELFSDHARKLAGIPSAAVAGQKTHPFMEIGDQIRRLRQLDATAQDYAMAASVALPECGESFQVYVAELKRNFSGNGEHLGSVLESIGKQATVATTYEWLSSDIATVLGFFLRKYKPAE